jgi:RecJ-like exonuclease
MADKKCSVCKGTGEIPYPAPQFTGVCPRCRGTGIEPKKVSAREILDNFAKELLGVKNVNFIEYDNVASKYESELSLLTKDRDETIEGQDKQAEYCPQHGYPLPCYKCGYTAKQDGMGQAKKEERDRIRETGVSVRAGYNTLLRAEWFIKKQVFEHDYKGVIVFIPDDGELNDGELKDGIIDRLQKIKDAIF